MTVSDFPIFASYSDKMIKYTCKFYFKREIFIDSCLTKIRIKNLKIGDGKQEHNRKLKRTHQTAPKSDCIVVHFYVLSDVNYTK